MQVKYKLPLIIGITTLAIAGIALAVVLTSSPKNGVADDVRTQPPLVALTTTKGAGAVERSFTGVVAARVASDLAFRVPGKVVERLVDAGDRVTAGQPLMRIDENDLRLVLIARKNAVISARALVVQASADEQRLADLKEGAAVSRQAYEQAKALKDSSEAQLAAAEANAAVAENEAAYSVLKADADGTVIETMGEPGQIVAAGQAVVRLAHSGPREAVVFLPETLRPALKSTGEASIYGTRDSRSTAVLRQLSDSAEPQTRTYEARYVLDGKAALAPLGSTVTIHLKGNSGVPEVEVPLGAVHDDGRRTGIWVLDPSSTVHFQPVEIKRLTEETAVITGIGTGKTIVAIGAHFLAEGALVQNIKPTESSR